MLLNQRIQFTVVEAVRVSLLTPVLNTIIPIEQLRTEEEKLKSKLDDANTKSRSLLVKEFQTNMSERLAEAAAKLKEQNRKNRKASVLAQVSHLVRYGGPAVLPHVLPVALLSSGIVLLLLQERNVHGHIIHSKKMSEPMRPHHQHLLSLSGHHVLDGS